MSDAIEFSGQAFWDGDRESVITHVQLGEKRIRCVITIEFLLHPYAKTETIRKEKALDLYRERQSEIESTTRERIGRNAIEKNIKDSMTEIVLRPPSPV